MKRFLLVLGIFLCLQGCTLAKNLYDLGFGHYIDKDSLRREGDYGYATIEYHSNTPRYNMVSQIEYDLIKHRDRYLKVYILDSSGKIVEALEDFELPEYMKEWTNIPKTSMSDVILETLKKIEPTNVIK